MSYNLDQEIEAKCQEIAQKMADETLLKPLQLQSPELLFKRYKQQLQEEFAKEKAVHNRGALGLASALKELKGETPSLFTEEVTNSIAQFSKLPERISEDTERFTAFIEQGGTLQEFAGINNETMNVLYLAGKHLFDKGQFEEAACVFFFLTGLNPKTYVFWEALANSEFHQKRFNEALDALSHITDVDPPDASVQCTLSRCYEEIGNIDLSLQALERAQLAPNIAEWQERVTEAKARLTSRSTA